jgi:predicted permease
MHDRMTRLLAWTRSRVRWRRDPDADLAEEIRLHLEARIRAFVAQGLTADQARAAAHRQFGPVEPVKEACRDERRRAAWIGTVWQDLRYGIRGLARDRAFTIAAVVTLSLGLALVTSFFTVFNGLLLKPWPLPNPGTLVTTKSAVPAATYRQMRDQTKSVDLVAMTSCGGFIEDDFKGASFRCVSGNYFEVLGVPLIHGRGLRPDEDVVGAPARVTVIGYSLWRERFARSPEAIGRTIRLNQVPFQIVGVAAPGATDRPEKNLPTLWVPLAAYPLVTSDTEFNRGFLTNPEYCCVRLAGRLAHAGSRRAVSAELTTLYERLLPEVKARRPFALTGTRQIEQPWEKSGAAITGVVFAAVVLVLTIACANTANLQWARGARRQQELQIRLSLGANRSRLLRQLLTEGLPLAATAMGASLTAASLLASALARWLGDGRADDLGVDLSPDWRVAVLAASVAAIAVLATTLGPALRGTRRLIGSGRSATPPPPRTRAWLLVVQVGLSAILIVGASLLARNLMRASALDPGFDADGVVSARVLLPGNRSRETRLPALHAAARAALPAQVPPLLAEAGPIWIGRIAVTAGGPPFAAAGRSVSVSYLPLLSVPLRAGRMLQDGGGSAEVVVNETFAARAWPGKSALGAMFRDTRAQGGGVNTAQVESAFDTPRMVVGVVGDMRQGIRPGEPVEPAFFEVGSGTELFIRHNPAVLERVRVAMQAADPTARVGFEPLSATFEVGLLDMRIGVALAWALGLVALAMSCTGVFGLCAIVAEERRREVGIRVALGAGVSAIVRLMLMHAGRPLVAGLVVGFAGALLAAPFLRRYLAVVGPHDPIAFLVAALVLSAAGAMATFVPIRRALRVDPAITLRAE